MHESVHAHMPLSARLDVLVVGAGMLQLNVQELLASSLGAQVQCLAEAAVLKPLIATLLPVTQATAAAASRELLHHYLLALLMHCTYDF